ncbi:PQQ-binding-like beta-propeller repeat protein [Candidatus Poribacteria bacterium]|nr:PQQ-binding-like beta-propeller repeat protein [Candidatus Poribacteria bacterium]
MKTKIFKILIIFICLLVITANIYSETDNYTNNNWTQFRADASRSGHIDNKLPSDLGLSWLIKASAPTPAWVGVHTRITSDHVYQPVIKDKLMYYGSSTDHQIHAVNIDSGEEVWTFFTDAPVRMAPAVWKDKLFINSDDGNLYCVSADKGELIWKKNFRADIYKLGNNRMVSNWPSRGGIAVKNDVLYYGAGIWPSDGIDIVAMNPETGEVKWINDSSGEIWYKQPHGAAEAYSGISCQGYLLVTDDHVIVPTGRSVPAGFDINTGELSYYHLQKYGSYGGDRVFANNDYLFVTTGNTRDYEEIIGLTNGIFGESNGERITGDQLKSPGLAMNSQYIFSVDPVDLKLKAYDVENFVYSKKAKDRRGNDIDVYYMSEPAWTIQTIEKAQTISLISAHDKVIAATTNGKVTVFDTEKKDIEWAAEVEGIPYGLAVAQGKLFISTDKGYIYCYDDIKRAGRASIIAKEINNSPYGENDLYETAAREIIKESDITHGYCIDIGCGDGALAYEIVKRTNLYVVAVDPDPENVRKARKILNSAGIYGSRVVVQQSEYSLDRYPSYFANLVISRKSVDTGESPIQAKIPHVQRPYGGVMMVGKTGSMSKSVQDALSGAGEWTHMYADPGNSLCSMDDKVKGDLGILWWNDPDFDVPSRHGRGVAPLFKDGLMFVQGVHGIRAYDAYNGHQVWDYYIEDLAKHYDQDNLLGAAITASNYAIDGDRMYVRVGMQQYSKAFRQVHVLDIYTGNHVKTLRSPSIEDPGKSRWGALNYWGFLFAENGTVYGSIVDVDHIVTGGYREADMSHQFSESRAVFAMDAETGKVKWMYEAKDSIRHNTFAIGDGMVFFIDRPQALQDRLRSPERAEGLKPGKLTALDAETGEEIYSVNNDFATLLAVNHKNDIIIATQQHTRFKLPSEAGGRIAAYKASTGDLLWNREIGVGKKPAEWVKDLPDGAGPDYYYPYTGSNGPGSYNYASRPIIIDNEVFLEPFSLSLETGKDLDRPFGRTYNCGMICAGKHMLTFRSGTFGYLKMDDWYDGVNNWGGFRPACWVHTIVAGGLVLVPEGQARCNCSYQMLPSVVFAPRSNLSPNEQAEIK